ncbi:MAG: SDR family oxidoreductase [Chlamydiota bacterium]
MDKFKNKLALVTGASSGIGKEIAHKLAAEGCHLILVARRNLVLIQLASQLQSQFGIRCEVISADLAAAECVALIVEQVNTLNLQVDILVNNAGFGTYGLFETISPSSEQDEIAVNIAALVGLTHAFIPGMLKRGSGSVLNIASTAAFQPVAFLAVYAATKAFVLSFSEALWGEYQGRGIHVVALCPPAVDTEFASKLGNNSIKRTSSFSKPITAEHVAAQAIQVLKRAGPSYIIGFKNWLMANSLRFAPRSLVARASAALLRPSSQK